LVSKRSARSRNR